MHEEKEQSNFFQARQERLAHQYASMTRAVLRLIFLLSVVYPVECGRWTASRRSKACQRVTCTSFVIGLHQRDSPPLPSVHMDASVFQRAQMINHCYDDYSATFKNLILAAQGLVSLVVSEWSKMAVLMEAPLQNTEFVIPLPTIPYAMNGYY